MCNCCSLIIISWMLAVCGILICQYNCIIFVLQQFPVLFSDPVQSVFRTETITITVIWHNWPIFLELLQVGSFPWKWVCWSSTFYGLDALSTCKRSRLICGSDTRPMKVAINIDLCGIKALIVQW